MTTLQYFPNKPRRAVKQLTVNVDAAALTGPDWELLNERIKLLFGIGAAEVAAEPVRVTPGSYPIVRRDYHAAARLIDKPMSAGEASIILQEHFQVGEAAIRCKHWPRVKMYLRMDGSRFVYDDALIAAAPSQDQSASQGTPEGKA